MDGFAPASLRTRVVNWLTVHDFSILEEDAVDEEWKYLVALEVDAGQVELRAPPGSLIAVNVLAGGDSSPVLFCLKFTEVPGGTSLHAELFLTEYVEPISFGHPSEHPVDAPPIGIGPLYQARLRVQAVYDAFVAELRAWGPCHRPLHPRPRRAARLARGLRSRPSR
jgi:hypothetical protein